jgi:hypothetical protein
VHRVISRRGRSQPRSSATRLRIADPRLSAEVGEFLGRAGWIVSIAPDGVIEVATRRVGAPRAIGWSELENLLKVLALMHPTLEVELAEAAPELEPA